MLARPDSALVLHVDAFAADSGVAGPTASCARHLRPFQRTIMGKYFIAWILGVPAVVLVAVYFFTHM